MVQRVWGWRCGLLQVLVMLSSAVAAADSVYRLVPPQVYVVLGGDLEVRYQLPGDVSLPNAFVQLRGQLPRDLSWREITTLGLPLGAASGTLTAACGVVEFAGKYSLTMYMHVDGEVLTEVSFNAVWPLVQLRLPLNHYALMSAVSMEIESRACCRSRLHREFLTLELYFQRVQQSGTAFAQLAQSVKVAEANYSSIHKESVRWTYACRVFDLDGLYQAVLRSSAGGTVSVSNVMGVTFSASYHLSARSASVFPCRHSLDVLYTHPACTGVDKFRVYKLVKQAEGSAASPLDKVYVTELDSHPDRSRFGFNCSLFELSAMGYCFVYASVSRTGTVVEQNQMCLPAQPGAVLPQDGGWSPWTSWTTCSVTCGTGRRHRFRMCNNPSPEYGGRYCAGHAVQWAHCQLPCPDELPRTPLRSPQLAPGCPCGCTVRSDSGQIVASGRCSGLAVWVITTSPGQQVTLTFRYYDIAYDRQWVKVRDGGSERDDLLFYSRVQQSRPADVKSTSNVMRVELMTEVMVTSPAETAMFPDQATLPIHTRGFIAAFAATAPAPGPQPPALFRHEQPSVMENGVTIVGMAVVVVVVAAVVVVAVVQRKYWRRMPKYRPASSGDSPARVSSSQSSQPSSPGPHVQVDMDIPLTGGSGARRKSSSGQRAASRASSISSTCSAGLKKIRSRADNLAGEGGAGGGGSPKPSSKDYSTLDSPHSHPASPDDTGHDANVFRASPILRHVAPRSPKVHPHRLKASPVTPSSPGPSPLTKHEMLTRKRQERRGVATPGGEGEEEREVTGSSGSGSTGVPPSAVSTTAAQVHLSRSPDSRALTSVARLHTPTEAKSARSAGTGSKRQSQGEPASESEEIPLMDSVEELLPHQLGLEPGKSPACEETSFMCPQSRARRPTSLTDSYSQDAIQSRGSTRSRTPKSPPAWPSAMEERQTLLPKPDGQSPKSEREDKASRDSSSPSKSSLGGKSHKTMSPTRSIATPELEYDDFIMDDPLSYFEYEELSRLNWTGTEKLGRTRKREDT